MIDEGNLTKDYESTAKFCLLVNDIFDHLNNKIVTHNNREEYIKVFL